MAVNWKEVDRLAQAHLLIDPTASEADLWRQLKVWWCITYQRPFKDPLIETYTLDELVYEYLIWYYRDPENDPAQKESKEEREKADREWALSMLKEFKEKKVEPEKKPEAKPQPQPQAPPPNPPPDISTRFDE